MTTMYTMPITPARQGSKLLITQTVTPVEVDVNNIAIYTLSAVPDYRQLEIINAWRWLWNGVRDRNILTDFAAGPVYSAVSIDKIGETDRRTSTDLVSLNTDDVVIAIGATARSVDATNILESGFAMLRDHAREAGLLAA